MLADAQVSWAFHWCSQGFSPETCRLPELDRRDVMDSTPCTHQDRCSWKHTPRCAQGQILDSKEFYAPIITPFEAQVAFAPEGDAVAAAQGRYSLGFDDLLSSSAARTGTCSLLNASHCCAAECTAVGCMPYGPFCHADTAGAGEEAPRFSLIDGSYHGGASDPGDSEMAPGALAERAARSLNFHAGLRAPFFLMRAILAARSLGALDL